MVSEIFEFLGSLHPLIVHLPIGFIILTLLINFVFKTRNNSVKRLITLGWFFSFISGFIASIFGWFLGDNNYYLESQINIHKWTGFAFVIITFLIWMLRALNFNLPKSFNRISNFTVFILILITGHFGGEMTHGKGYLVKSIPFLRQNKMPNVLLTEKENSLDSIYVFEDLIYPVFEEKCIACHNKKQAYGGLNMNTFDNLIRGGNNGLGIHKDNPYKSLIYKRVSMSQNEAKFMPPTGTPLSFNQVAVLKWWIDNGAKLKVPLTKLRNDENIRGLVEENYRLDLREKPYIETLKLPPINQNKLEVLDEGKYQWRFLNIEKSLLDVKFVGKKITFNDIELLLKLKEHIIWLNLSNCQLKDDMLSLISEFKNLTRLRVQKNNLTDKCIPHLKDINNLKELNLYDTLITDNSFEVLIKMESLEKVFLWKSEVSTLGVEKFKRQKSKIEVITGL